MAYVKLDDVLNIIREVNHNLAGLIQHLKEHCPTADVVEVKHGKWKKRIDDEFDCECIECSACGEEFFPPNNDFIFDSLPNYCPNCGANMKRR